MSDLTREDIIILAPRVLEELGRVFSFSGGQVITGPDLLAEIRAALPRTTVKRASETILKNQAVWDRINNQVWLPLGKAGSICPPSPAEGATSHAPTPLLGVMTLKGVGRTVTPEEGSRWLPVLSALVVSLYNLLKQRSLIQEKDGVPEYMALFMEARKKGGIYPELSHILFCETGSRWRDDIPARVFNKAMFAGRMEGGRAAGSWWLVQVEPQKIPIYFETLLKKGAKKAFLIHRSSRTGFQHGRPGAASVVSVDHMPHLSLILREKEEMEVISRLLGLSCLSTEVLSRLGEKAGIVGDVGAFFRTLKKNLDAADTEKGTRERGSEIIGIRFSDPGTKDPSQKNWGKPLDKRISHFVQATKGLFPKHLVPILQSGDMAFYLSKGLLNVGREPEDHLCRALSMQARAHGVRVSLTPLKKNGSRSEVLRTLFWTCVHAGLMDAGSIFETGSITYQVAGDECFSHGDIKAAIHYFKRSLRLDSENVDALNSLGVSCARLGRRKSAQVFFIQAMELAPGDPSAYYNLGCLLMDRDVEEAARLLSRAHENSQGDIFITARYLEALLEARADALAEKILKDLASMLDSGTPLPWVLRVVSRAYFLLGDTTRASLIARKVLCARPNDPEALYICAVALEAREGKNTALNNVFKKIAPAKMTSRRLKSHYFSFRSRK